MDDLFSGDVLKDEELFPEPIFTKNDQADQVTRAPLLDANKPPATPDATTFKEKMDVTDQTSDAEDQQREPDKLRNALAEAGEQDAGEAQKLQDLAFRSGLPIDIVAQDPARVQEMLFNSNLDAVSRGAPVIRRKILTDPNFAAAARKDVENLTFWETKFNKMAPIGPEPTFGEQAQNAALSLLRGSIRVPKTVLDLMQLTGNFFGGEDFRGSTTGKAIANLEENFFQRSLDIINQEFQAKSVQEQLAGNEGFLPNLSQVISTGFELIPQLPGMFSVGAGGQQFFSALGAGTRVSAFGAGASTSIVFSTAEVYNQTVTEAREAFKNMKGAGGVPRYTPQEIERLSQRAAFYATGLNTVPTGLLGGIGLGPAFRATGGVLRRAMVGAVSDLFPEGLQEVGEEIAGQAGIKFSGDPDREIFAPENLPRFSQAFVLGGMLGFASGGTFGALSGFADESIQSNKAAVMESVFRAMGENAQESELAETLPKVYQDAVKEATKDGPVHDVYIDAAGMNEYFQSIGVAPSGVLRGVPGAEEQLEEAEAAGEGTIRIPIEMFATEIARSEHFEGLLPHMKFDPADFTQAEAQVFRETETERLQEESERIFEEGQRTDAFTESSEQVRAQVQEQLEATGRMSPEVAQQDAVLHQARAEVLALKMRQIPGFETIMPHEAAAKFGLSVQAQGGPTPVPRGRRELSQLAQGLVQTPEFQQFFEGSKVVDEQGEPRVVFRGEHGPGGELRQVSTLLGSPTFSTAAAANIYALDPNQNIGSDEQTDERVTPAFLSIKKPLVDDVDDPFVDFGQLSDAIGVELAQEFVNDNFGDFQATGAADDIRNELGLDPLEVIEQNPARARELVIEAYKVFDDPHMVELLQDAGFDGAIHGGVGDTSTEPEFRVFDESQIKSIFNRGTFDPNETNILFQEPTAKLNPNWSYSFLGEAIQGLDEKKAQSRTGKEWLKVIKAIPGVKKEEIQWTGLEEFLNMGPVTTSKDIPDAEAEVATRKKAVQDAENQWSFLTKMGIKDDTEIARDNLRKAQADLSALQKGKFSRGQIMEWLETHGVQVQDVGRGAFDQQAFVQNEVTQQDIDNRAREIMDEFADDDLRVDEEVGFLMEDRMREIEERYNERVDEVR